jgi:hypothetical protein
VYSFIFSSLCSVRRLRICHSFLYIKISSDVIHAVNLIHKMDLAGIGFSVVDWIGLAQDRESGELL